MTVPSLFKEYIWLVNTIKRARRITFAEIQEKWLETEMSGGVDFARSTFNRHKDAIQDIFGIYIECDRKNGYKYYIGNEHVLHEDSVQNWIISTMSVNDIILESKALNERILLQQIPCNDYLQMVMKAMKKKVRGYAYRKWLRRPHRNGPPHSQNWPSFYPLPGSHGDSGRLSPFEFHQNYRGYC